MKFKACTAFKVADDMASGQFEAIVSVFGNIDHVGDVVMPGAFTETLAAWKATGDPIPVLWSHRMDDPRFSIGVVQEAAELMPGDARIPEWVDTWIKEHGGLWVRAQLDMGADASEVAVAARKLLADRRVKQFSFAYDTLDSGWGKVDGQEVYELRKLGLFEVSCTLVGCNDLTQLLGAKAAALASGWSDLIKEPTKFARLVSDMTEAEFRAVLDEMAKADSGRRNDGGTTEGEPAKREEPEGAKREEPPTLDAATDRLLADLSLLELEVALS